MYLADRRLVRKNIRAPKPRELTPPRAGWLISDPKRDPPPKSRVLSEISVALQHDLVHFGSCPLRSKSDCIIDDFLKAFDQGSRPCCAV
jgi:hypothetical protein